MARKVHLWNAYLKDARAHRVPQKRWPKAEVDFDRMSGDLRRAVEAAVRSATRGYDTDVSDWTWNVYDQAFTFVVGTLVDVGETQAHVTLRMAFNPKVAWLDEIERVMIDAEKHVREICTALEKKQ